MKSGLFTNSPINPRIGKMGLCAIYCRTSKGDEHTTERQIIDGVKFAKESGFEYHVYDEPDRSGYLIEDDADPFKDRPAMTELINDIKEGIVDKIWVWEHSRLARKEIAAAYLFNVFEKHSIVIYDKGRRFDMTDPQTRMIMGILKSVAEYERHLIKARTSDGVQKATDIHGRRGTHTAYGYAMNGKDERNKNRQIWVPVEHELRHVRFAYDNFLAGKPVREIVEGIAAKRDMPERERLTLENRWRRILSNDIYTGHILNTDAKKEFKRFRRNELDSIHELADEKHWVRSPSFTRELITVDEWIRSVSLLQAPKIKYMDAVRRTGSAMATGLVACPICGLKYFLYRDGEDLFYRHHSNGRCAQKPKRFAVHSIDRVFDLFYFAYCLIFDDAKELIARSQKAVEMELETVKARRAALEKEARVIGTRLENANRLLDREGMGDSDIAEFLKIRREFAERKEACAAAIKELNIALDGLNVKYNADALELAYTDTDSKITDFFEGMGVDGKKVALGRVIKRCHAYGNHILIDAGRQLFVFDRTKRLEITPEIYAEFKADSNRFKDNFMRPSSSDAGLMERFVAILERAPMEGDDAESFRRRRANNLANIGHNAESYLAARRLGDITVAEYRLDRDWAKKAVGERLSELGIDHDLSDAEKAVCFTELF